MSAKRRQAKAGRRPAGIPDQAPDDTRYVNVTTLTDEILKEGASVSIDQRRRILYVGLAVLCVVVAVLIGYVIPFEGSIYAAAILTILGLNVLYFESRMGAAMARKASKAFEAAGPEARVRTTFFTPSEVGVIKPDGSVATYSYSDFTAFRGDALVDVLVVKGTGDTLILARDGFTHGSARDFESVTAKRVAGDI